MSTFSSSRHWEAQFSRRRDQYEQRRDFERRPPQAYYISRETELLGERRRYPVQSITPRQTHEGQWPVHEMQKQAQSAQRPAAAVQRQASAVQRQVTAVQRQAPAMQRQEPPVQRQAPAVQRQISQFNVPTYSKVFSKPILKKVIQQSRQVSIEELTSKKNTALVRNSQSFVAPAPPTYDTKSAPPKPVERNIPPQRNKPLVSKNENLHKEPDKIDDVKFTKRTSQESLEKQVPPKALPLIQSASKATNNEEFEDESPSKFFNKPPQKPIEERSLVSASKPSTSQGSGLLTDSLSCIFTRRAQKNIQHKVPQKRVFFEEVPQRSEDKKEKEDPPSDTESTYLSEKKTKFETPEKQCPEPPIISQATPNITNEDWFATKQRILSSVNHDSSSKSICEPPVARENKCPEPPQISVDPHGFDIEPPDHLNKNVSPYVPTNSCEREEYNKYKSQQLKKEAAFILAQVQKRYKQGFEAPSTKSKVVQEVRKEPTSYLKDNEENEKADTSYKEVSNYQQYQRYETQPPLQEHTAYEPITTVADSHRQISYEPTKRYDAAPPTHQNENLQEYEYQQSQYNMASYEEQASGYENPPANYQAEVSSYYDQQQTYEQMSYNEPQHSEEVHTGETVPLYESGQQNNYDDQSNLENMCPEAPQISEDSQMVKQKLPEDFENIPPDAPRISQRGNDNEPSYYQDDNYRKYNLFDEQNSFKEPLITQEMSNQKMCHRCSFQTTNAKKLRDHLKFVHGEATTDISPSSSQHANDLFSRREPQLSEGHEFFSRREQVAKQEEVTTERTQQQPIQIRFKRRNTALVNVISSDIVVPARQEANKMAEGNLGEGEKVQGQTQDTGVLAALEYFETNKDQPKKPRPYRRNPDDLDKNDWL